ncbi:MAG: hypothetical protein WA364_17460 [Candidatus Nitrosopolaris sp.]
MVANKDHENRIPFTHLRGLKTNDQHHHHLEEEEDGNMIYIPFTHLQGVR